METFMDEALTEAKKALEKGEVPVGCVFVYEEKIIARSGNLVNDSSNATRHAEFECMDMVLEYCSKNGLKHEEVFPLVSVVVTVEPCIMCAASLYEFGVKEIIYGCENDRFGGKTVVDVSEFYEKDISITGGIRSDEAMALLKEFYKGKNPSAPDDIEMETDDTFIPNVDSIPSTSADIPSTSQDIKSGSAAETSDVVEVTEE